jgi:hypothetical protein
VTTYTELTTKDLLAQTHAFIRELEGKAHASDLQAAMNLRVQAYYAGLKPPNKGAAENAKQQVAKDLIAVREITHGLPALKEHLAALQALDDKEEAAREAALPSESEEGEPGEAETHAAESPSEPSRKNGRALAVVSRDG